MSKILSKIKRIFYRPPDFFVPGYLRRWYVIPKTRWFNIYLHNFLASDYDRHLHDHRAFSVSFLLRGEILEHSLNWKRHVPWLFPVFRGAKLMHRIEIMKGPVWTIFIKFPDFREWGYLTEQGWMQHEEYDKVYNKKDKQ